MDNVGSVITERSLRLDQIQAEGQGKQYRRHVITLVACHVQTCAASRFQLVLALSGCLGK
jgi:hypothetical protein